MSEAIRVAIIDDHPLMREGVIHTLSADNDIVVVGEGESARDALEIAQTVKPAIMLLDLDMPGDGLIAAEEISKKCPSIKLVILTVSESPRHIEAAIDNRLQGYILKGVSGSEIRRAVKLVHEGKPYFSPEVVPTFLNAGAMRSDTTLTAREKDILKLISHGLTNKEISIRLTLSEKTVKYYLTTIFKKLGVRNRIEAAMSYSSRNGSF